RHTRLVSDWSSDVCSSDLGALAGILYSSNVRLEPSLDILGLKAFAVALVGGLDSLGGVIPAAVLVALIEVLSVRYGNPLLSDVRSEEHTSELQSLTQLLFR